jgi:hypothetical protein
MQDPIWRGLQKRLKAPKVDDKFEFVDRS